MCGIFGAILKQDCSLNQKLFRGIVDNLLLLSESRGKEAAGIAFFIDDTMELYKEGTRVRRFIKGFNYRAFIKKISDTLFSGGNKQWGLNYPCAFIGHTRLATNGTQYEDRNNCPIVLPELVGVHNGIVVNDDELCVRFLQGLRSSDVDSEIVFRLLEFFTKKGLSLSDSIREVFVNIKGSATIAAFMRKNRHLILATNTGCLYFCKNSAKTAYLFASEQHMLKKTKKRIGLSKIMGTYDIRQLKAGFGCIVNIDLAEDFFSFYSREGQGNEALQQVHFA